VRRVAQFSKAQQQVKHQLHENRGSIKDLSCRQMAEALLQPYLEGNHLKKPLNDDQPRKRRQPLILEPQLGDRGGFCSHALSATLHRP
jgi:hypothetical protein